MSAANTVSAADKYEAVIGLEVHVQLATKSKMFCRCDNDSEGKAPNTNVCPVCLAMPGTLPVPNRTAVEYALKASLALGCEIPQESKFDRKQYFYPDLPKGYQISQYDQPFGGPGTFEFDLVREDGTVEPKRIGITRLHLEEDAGKLTHPAGADYSLVDLNRAGTPLAEIVTEPDLRSPAEAKAFMQELRLLMRTIGVSDADMEKGHLRADANISVRPKGQKEFGVKTELKNLNSFRFVEKGLEVEFARQVELLEKGETVDQETRGFDEKKNRTVSQRGKEEAHDYRYFPEPDIPPLKPHELGLDALKAELPELPVARKRRLRSEGISEDSISVVNQNLQQFTLLNDSLQKMRERLDEIDKPVKEVNQRLENVWLKTFQSLSESNRKLSELSDFLVYVTSALERNMIPFSQVSNLANQYVKTNSKIDDLLLSVQAGMLSESDLKSAVEQAIADNPKPAEDFKKGNENAAQAIVGSVMKATKGSADPRKVSQLIREKLSKS